MKERRGRQFSTVATVSAVGVAITSGRLPRRLRVALLTGLVMLACGAGVLAYRHVTHPKTLTVAAGSLSGISIPRPSAGDRVRRQPINTRRARARSPNKKVARLIATRAAALAPSRSRTPLPQASRAPPPFECVLQGSRGAVAWTSEHWIRRRARLLMWRKLRVDLAKTRQYALNQQLDCANAPARQIRRECRLHCTATFVSENHEQLRVEMRACVLEAAKDFRRNNVARYPNDEQFAELCIKNQFRRYPQVAAAEDGRKRMLALDELGEHLQLGSDETRGSPRRKRALPSIKRASASSAPIG